MSEKGLGELRAEIDRNNRALLELLSQRAALVERVREVKERSGAELYDPHREREMLDQLVAANPGPFPDETIRALFRQILDASLALMQGQGRVRLRVHRRAGEPDRVVEVGAVARLGEAPQFVAGPCAVEDRQGLRRVAGALAAEGVRFLRGGAFKSRSSPYSFQGLGEDGLRILAGAAREYGMACVTEVVDTRSAELTAGYADVLQVGTRNMANYELLKELGRLGKPVLIKRGQAATIDELLLAAEYVAAQGNEQLVLCERGIRTFTRHTRSTLDISAVPLLKLKTGLPVLVDVSHAAGRRDLLQPLAAVALAAGADGVMVEVHDDPPSARSDGAQQLSVEGFVELARALRAQMPALAPA